MRNFLIIALSVLAFGFAFGDQCQEIKDALTKGQDFEYSFTCENNKDGEAEKLNIKYNVYSNQCIGYCHEHKLATISKNVLKDLKSLKELVIFGIDLSQDNINDISTLENLELLSVNNCNYKNVTDLSSLNNLKKVTSLSASNEHTFESEVPEDLINIFKSVKELNVKTIKSVADFVNLENLTVQTLEDTSSLEKCTKLKKLTIGNTKGLSVLENIPSLVHLNIVYTLISGGYAMFPYANVDFKFSESNKIENLYFEGFNITDDNMNEIMKLENLKNTYYFNSIFYLMNEESHDNYEKFEELNNPCPFVDIPVFIDHHTDDDDNEYMNYLCNTYKNTNKLNPTTTTADADEDETSTVVSDDAPTTVAEQEIEPTTTIAEQDVKPITEKDVKPTTTIAEQDVKPITEKDVKPTTTIAEQDVKSTTEKDAKPTAIANSNDSDEESENENNDKKTKKHRKCKVRHKTKTIYRIKKINNN